MGLFSKKTSLADLNEAKDFVTTIKKETNFLVENFINEDCQSVVELTTILTLSYICSGVLSKNAKACLSEAIYLSLTKYKFEQSKDGAKGFIDIMLGNISNTFQTALKRGNNPLEEVFDSFFQGQFLTNFIFTNNEFFIADAKKAINKTIDKVRVSSLYQFKFSANEVKYPQPHFFVNFNKAPRKILTTKSGQDEIFFVVDTVDHHHKTYFFLVKDPNEFPIIYTTIDIGPTQRIEFVDSSNSEYEAIMNKYNNDIVIFNEYDCPAY